MLRCLNLAIPLLALVFGCAGGEPNAGKPDPEPGSQTTAKPEPEPQPKPEPDPPKPEMKDGFWIDQGAPEPRACEQDLDCIGAVPPADGGCCNDAIRLEAYSTTYRDWLYDWRKEHCADVKCPPPPAPAQPLECMFKVTCTAGICRNTCPEPGDTDGTANATTGG